MKYYHTPSDLRILATVLLYWIGIRSGLFTSVFIWRIINTDPHLHVQLLWSFTVVSSVFSRWMGLFFGPAILKPVTSRHPLEQCPLYIMHINKEYNSKIIYTGTLTLIIWHPHRFSMKCENPDIIRGFKLQNIWQITLFYEWCTLYTIISKYMPGIFHDDQFGPFWSCNMSGHLD